MKDKINIEELFKKELGSYKPKVDPSVWASVQAGLGTGVASTGGLLSGVLGKVAIGIIVAAALTTAVYFGLKDNNGAVKPENSVQKLEISRKENSKENPKLQNVVQDTTLDKEDALTKEIKKPLTKIEEDIPTKDVLEEKQEMIVSFADTLVPKELAEQESTIESKDTHVVPVVDHLIEKQDAPVNKIVEQNKWDELSSIQIQQDGQYCSFYVEGLPNEFQSLEWNFGDGNYSTRKNPEHFYATQGMYEVTLAIRGQDTLIVRNVMVEVVMKGELLTLPNTFTPNGDGKNDIFFIESENLIEFQITIMNKQKNIVYSSNDIHFRWNGIAKNGVPVADGHYYYIVVGKDAAGNVINKYQELYIHR